MMKINTIRVINSYGDLKELFALNTDKEILNFIEKKFYPGFLRIIENNLLLTLSM